jgi:DNA-binding protein HU-beta
LALTVPEEEVRMNKAELVDAVAAASGVSKSDVDSTISSMFDVIAAAVKKGDKVQVTGWLSVEQVMRSARTGRNPQTGETLNIPASKAVKVTAGAKLKGAVK